jgi:hypothetical protein
MMLCMNLSPDDSFKPFKNYYLPFPTWVWHDVCTECFEYNLFMVNNRTMDPYIIIHECSMYDDANLSYPRSWVIFPYISSIFSLSILSSPSPLSIHLFFYLYSTMQHLPSVHSN